MQGEAELVGQGTRLVIVDPFVEAEMLGLMAGRLGAPHRDGGEGLTHQLMVVAVGPVDHRPERDAAGIGQQRTLDPALAPIRGIAAGFSPHPAALCPSPRPAPARSSQCPAGRHRPVDPCARTSRTLRPSPIPESADAPRKRNRSWSPSAHSTGTPSAARKRSRPSPPGPAPAGYGSRAGVGAGAVAEAPSAPTAHPAGASHHPEPFLPSSSARSFSASIIDGDPPRLCLPG